MHTSRWICRYAGPSGLILTLALAGCGPGAESLTDADGVAAGSAPSPFRYNREYIFVASRSEAPIVVPFIFRSMDDGSEMHRTAHGWLARGATWDRFLEEAGRTSRAGGVWRVVPQGDLRLIAGGPAELEALGFERGERRLRLDLSAPLTGWNQGGESRFRLLSGHLSIGQESMPGPVLEVLHVEQTLEDGWPPGQDFDSLFLTSGDSVQFVLVEAFDGDAAGPAFAWVRTPSSERRLGEVEIRWLEMRPFQDARRDIPLRWSFQVRSGELRGEVEALGYDALLGPERGGRRAVEIRYTVGGWAELDGETREVTGMIRHTQQ